MTRATIDWYRSLHEGRSWDLAVERIRKIETLARERKSRFLIVALPLIWQVGGGYPLVDIHHKVGELARADGIEFLDALPLFAGIADWNLYLHPKDRHPNSRYTRTVAEAVADRVFK
jgi:hypothetical protein